MAAITVKLDTRNLIGRIERLQANAPAAVNRALSRAIVSARTAMVPPAAADLGVKQSDVRDATSTSIGAEDGAKVTATLSASITRIPLINFNARGPEPSRGKGAGVTARMPGGAGRYPHAFIATMRSGHRGVFERAARTSGRSPGAWSNNLPIVELRGPSVYRVLTKYQTLGLSAGQASLVKNLQSELQHAIRGAA